MVNQVKIIKFRSKDAINLKENQNKLHKTKDL